MNEMDLIGHAIFNHFFFQDSDPIIVDSNYTKGEILGPAHFFRSFSDMSAIEQEALRLCRGRILDIGAGAGSHALELQTRHPFVHALEKSEAACSVMKERGVVQVICGDIVRHDNYLYDTLILLMNGAGIGGTLEGLTMLLAHLRTLIPRDGQILLDSTDIAYLFEEDDGSVWIDLANDRYYGEMEYTLHYKDFVSEPFPWLFVDFGTLHGIAASQGLHAERIMDGEDSDYLARLTPAKK